VTRVAFGSPLAARTLASLGFGPHDIVIVSSRNGGTLTLALADGLTSLFRSIGRVGAVPTSAVVDPAPMVVEVEALPG